MKKGRRGMGEKRKEREKGKHWIPQTRFVRVKERKTDGVREANLRAKAQLPRERR